MSLIEFKFPHLHLPIYLPSKYMHNGSTKRTLFFLLFSATLATLYHSFITPLSLIYHSFITPLSLLYLSFITPLSLHYLPFITLLSPLSFLTIICRNVEVVYRYKLRCNFKLNLDPLCYCNAMWCKQSFSQPRVSNAKRVKQQ